MVAADGAVVAQRGAGLDGDLITTDQCTLVAQALGGGLGEIDHRREHVLAIDHRIDQPHDVRGQGGDLRGCQRRTQAQAQLRGLCSGVGHQVGVLRHGIAVAIQAAPAGELQDLVHHQVLLVITIAQALLHVGRVVAQCLQQVVGAGDGALGEARCGSDQERRTGVGVLLHHGVVGRGVAGQGMIGIAHGLQKPGATSDVVLTSNVPPRAGGDDMSSQSRRSKARVEKCTLTPFLH